MGLFNRAKAINDKDIAELKNAVASLDNRLIKDSFQNPNLNLGYGTGDNLQGTTFVPNHKTWNWLEINQIERAEPLFIKIVDYFASGYVNGGDITSVSLTNEQIKVIQNKLEDLKVGLYNTYYQSIFYGGGAGLLVFANETEEDYLKPLEIKNLKLHSFLGIKPLERWNGIFPDLKYRVEAIGKDGINDPSELGTPLYYEVRLYENGSRMIKKVRVHRSRLIVHNPIYLPYIQKNIERYWSSSIVEQLYDAYSRYVVVENAVANMLINSNTRVYYMEDTSGSAELTKRAKQQLDLKLDLIKYGLNFSNVFVVDKEDKVELLSANFANVPEIMEKVSRDLANSAGVPPSVLFGNGFDNSQETENSHRVLKNRQELHIKKDYLKLIAIICKTELNMEMPSDLKFTFNNICKTSDRDKADIIQKATSSLTEVYKSGAMDTETYIRSLSEINSNINDIFENYKENFIDKEGEKTYTERQIELAFALNKNNGDFAKETFSGNNQKELHKETAKVEVK